MSKRTDDLVDRMFDRAQEAKARLVAVWDEGYVAGQENLRTGPDAFVGEEIRVNPYRKRKQDTMSSDVRPMTNLERNALNWVLLCDSLGMDPAKNAALDVIKIVRQLRSDKEQGESTR